MRPERPEAGSPRELIVRYPEATSRARWPASARRIATSCPGTSSSVARRSMGLSAWIGASPCTNCARGDDAAMAEFRRLMYTTHDGDRVSWFDRRRSQHALYSSNRDSVADSRLEELLAASLNGVYGEELEAIQLRRQPGFYGASVPELDRLVDVTSMVAGVLGAGLMGAGGGGCVLILARDGEEVQQRVTAALAQHYYEPLGKAVEVEPWEATERAGEVEVSARSPRWLCQEQQSRSARRGPAETGRAGVVQRMARGRRWRPELA